MASKSKYKNKKTIVDGITFDSMAEAKRYSELKTYENSGAISKLELQKVFHLAESCVINGRKKPPLKYKADFVYMQNGKQVVEDKKGFLTQVYKMKRHLMKSVLGLDIFET